MTGPFKLRICAFVFAYEKHNLIKRHLKRKQFLEDKRQSDQS